MAKQCERHNKVKCQDCEYIDDIKRLYYSVVDALKDIAEFRGDERVYWVQETYIAKKKLSELGVMGSNHR